MKSKKGAASFYIVAFSTLILVVIATSFTTVILSELAKTANDELSQSAYDAALAGIEDAKVAFYNYQKCLSINTSECINIKNLMKNPNCDMVADILGRKKQDDGSVLIEEKSTSTGGTANNMQQAYTCVKIYTDLTDYRSTLTESDNTQVIKVRLGNKINGNKIQAKNIKKVEISWFSENDYRSTGGSEYKFTNIEGNKIAFPTLKGSDVNLAVPPMISVGLVQTADSFTLEQFTETESNKTNRGTVYLVPTNNGSMARGSDVDNYLGVFNGSSNVIGADRIVKSNNKAVKNVPLAVYCKNLRDSDADFACSATLELPEPMGGDRNDDTFIFVVSVPYGKPSTSFSLKFYCREGESCGGDMTDTTNQATLSGMQVEIDSTGRANNLYRRIGARLESADTYFPFPLYAIELLGDDDDGRNSLLKKPEVITCEYQSWGSFDPTC